MSIRSHSSKPTTILGYAHDFNETWRAQVDFQSGSENSATVGFTWNITRDFQVNPAIYLPNYHPDRVLGYVVFTYTLHLWGRPKSVDAPSTRKAPPTLR